MRSRTRRQNLLRLVSSRRLTISDRVADLVRDQPKAKQGPFVLHTECCGGTALVGFDVHNVRMARVNITMPDELYNEAKGAGLNVSRVAQDAIRAELARLGKVAELDAYLAELEAELGPPGDNERAEARTWADELFGPATHSRSA